MRPPQRSSHKYFYYKLYSTPSSRSLLTPISSYSLEFIRTPWKTYFTYLLTYHKWICCILKIDRLLLVTSLGKTDGAGSITSTRKSMTTEIFQADLRKLVHHPTLMKNICPADLSRKKIKACIKIKRLHRWTALLRNSKRAHGVLADLQPEPLHLTRNELGALCDLTGHSRL